MRERGLCVVGGGTMGEAIAAGLLQAGWLESSHLQITHHRRDSVDRLARQLGIHATSDNRSACAEAELILLCLKPQQMQAVVEAEGVAQALEGKLVVSIAAGITLDQLHAWLPKSTVVRAMPNTPCLIGQGMTVMARHAEVTDEQLSLVRRVFESVGRCVELDNKHMDAATALGGSGPAFAYVMLESLADGAVMMGLPRDVALEMAAQVFQGAAAMVLDTRQHPAALKDQVTTPAGCTIAGLLTMEDGRIRSVLARTIQEAATVARGLGDRP